jgi:hypothetical protein
MASLSAHLREPGDHGRLGFHPACPVCCEQRLAGRLPDDAIVSRRAQAVVTAGVLVFSTAAPTSVLAAGTGDQEQQGSADSVATSDPAADADTEPGDTDDLSERADTQPASDSDGTSDADDAVANPGASTRPAPAVSDRSQAGQPVPAKEPASAPPKAKPVAGSAPAATATPPTVTAPATPGAPSAPPTADPVAAVPATTTARVGQGRRLATKVRTRKTADVRALVARGQAGARIVRSVAATQSPAKRLTRTATRKAVAATQAAVAEPVVARSTVAVRDRRRAGPGDRVHVVLAGESLWSIANDVIGGRATVAQVAREVNRLWELNRARIGTGNRDLLPLGTRLELK